jgi:hypothetical protein
VVIVDHWQDNDSAWVLDDFSRSFFATFVYLLGSDYPKPFALQK